MLASRASLRCGGACRTNRVGLYVLLNIAVLGVTSCSRDDSDLPPDDALSKIEQLQALPYAGGVAGSEDDERGGVTKYDERWSQPGYNLYTIQYEARADLIDEHGNLLRSWSGERGGEWLHAELLDNGDILAVGHDPKAGPRKGPGPADGERYIARLNWDGDYIWKRYNAAHHDAQLTPEGQILTLTLKRTIFEEADPEYPLCDDHLTLLDGEGQVVDSFSLYKVLAAFPDDINIHIGGWQWFGGEPWIDPLHTNSAEWIDREDLEGRHPIFDSGNVLICYRHLNAITVINVTARKLIWTWGQGQLSGPHDARVLENGHILVFDNGIDPQRQASRVLEIDPVRGSVVWQYSAPEPKDFFTLGKGSAQRLANGNTLIASADQGWAFEVTKRGRIVWEFYCPYRTPEGQRTSIVRMRRYDRQYINGIDDAFRNRGK